MRPESTSPAPAVARAGLPLVLTTGRLPPAITVVELFNAANIYSNSHYKYLEPMTLVGTFFLLVSIPAAALAIRLENAFRRQT